MFDPGPIVLRVFIIMLELVGLHGIVGFFSGIFLVLGFIKLMFGNILFCRKTKSEAFNKQLKKNGLLPKSGTKLTIIITLYLALLFCLVQDLSWLDVLVNVMEQKQLKLDSSGNLNGWQILANDQTDLMTGETTRMNVLVIASKFLSLH